MSGDGANSPSLIQGTTPHSAANGVYLSCACAQSTSKAFNTQFQALSHFSAATATYAPESYDAANVIIAAMKSLKVISRKNIVAALHKIHYMGMTKAISFQPDGNIAGAAIYVSQVKNGQIVQLGLE
jgi:ABC-type branched-subunit amino acid transport system substrate-binding protein